MCIAHTSHIRVTLSYNKSLASCNNYLSRVNFVFSTSTHTYFFPHSIHEAIHWVDARKIFSVLNSKVFYRSKLLLNNRYFFIKINTDIIYIRNSNSCSIYNLQETQGPLPQLHVQERLKHLIFLGYYY